MRATPDDTAPVSALLRAPAHAAGVWAWWQMHQMFHARDATLSDAAARNEELTSRLGHDIAALRSAIGDGRSEAEAARVDVVQLVGGTRARLEAEAEAHAARGTEQLAAALAEVRREVAVAVESVRADGGALRTALETRSAGLCTGRRPRLRLRTHSMPCHATPCAHVRMGLGCLAAGYNALCQMLLGPDAARSAHHGCDVHARGADSLNSGPTGPIARYALLSAPPLPRR